MAKETMIVFVYDTEYCKDETRDPINAVLYFHPSWVSDVQKVALCGQLMGTTHFLKYCFFRPKIIALQNGKFVFKEFGRFLVAIGTDRNISDSLLEHRADLLASLIEFFHRDLQTIFDQFTASKYRNVSEKLYHIFGTYLPILQFNGNIFQNVPKLRIPKIASNIYLDAMQTLQSCQQTKGVLGGAILYHNKIVASQLSEVVTKNIVFTDPHRIKSTAETISVNFHVPVGVQMIAVYVPVNQYHTLSSDAYRSQNLQTQNLSNNAPTSYFQKRKMKRDRSIIFTNIPEENNCDHAETVDEIVKRNKAITRPSYLQLKEVTPRQLPEVKSVAKASEEFGGYPEFTGRTSVCSTPMTENKVLHGSGIMSICANPSEDITTSKIKTVKLNKLNKIDFDKMFNSFTSSTKKMERRNSFTDLQDSLKKISKKFSLKKNLSVGKSDMNSSDELIDAEKVYSANGRSPDEAKIFRATSDPVHPIISNSNNHTSRSSFDQLIEEYQNQINCETAAECEIEEQASDTEECPQNASVSVITKKTDGILDSSTTVSTQELPTNKFESKTLLDKKMLSLPLKTHSEVQSESVTTGLAFERRRLSGIQLTPLMAKLSILAFSEERNGGFYSRDINICADVATPITDDKLKSGRRSLLPTDGLKENSGQHLDGSQKLELYICGQQNMTMFLLLEQGSSNKQEIVQAMFDKCVAKLSKMESHLYQTLNVNMMEGVSEGVYSLICLDSKWDTLLNNGPWTPLDQSFLEHVHADLNKNQSITDILLRTNDCTLYGYKSGRTEFYFKESAHYFTGIPPPSDPMGTIATRAKTRLEEDFSIVLF